MKNSVFTGMVLAIVALFVTGQIAHAGWISPTDTPSSSGGPYGGMASLDAIVTIDGDVNTFCALLDDTLTGSDPGTTPPYAEAPTTGHILFDLGAEYSINGAKMTGRANPEYAVNPKSVDYYLSDASGSESILLVSHEYSALPSLGTENVSWGEVSARYIKMVVNSSYEEGSGGNYNFQLAEMEFSQVPEPSTMVVLITGMIGLLAYAWRKRQ